MLISTCLTTWEGLGTSLEYYFWALKTAVPWFSPVTRQSTYLSHTLKLNKPGSHKLRASTSITVSAVSGSTSWYRGNGGIETEGSVLWRKSPKQKEGKRRPFQRTSSWLPQHYASMGRAYSLPGILQGLLRKWLSLLLLRLSKKGCRRQ